MIMQLNTTILLSLQRSGTTFLDVKLNGMCGLNRHGGEIFFEKFFIRNEIEYLINCQTKEYNEKTDVKLRKTEIYSENCFYTANQATIQEMVKKSKNPVFNIQLGQINNNISLIKEIKTPILFLVRKNNWERCVSELVMQETEVSHIKKKSEILDVNLNKEKLIRNCKRTYNCISDFQKQLKNQKNVKIIYYEDVENKEYWTDEFIKELEDFMKVKFTDRNYIPPFKKTRNSVNIINEEEIVDEEYIKKYYIKEI